MTRRLSDGPFLVGPLDGTDLLEVTDKSDTSESPEGTTKTATAQQVWDGVPAGGGGVGKGTPFVASHLVEVQATAGDGTIRTNGIPSTDVARLSVGNDFAQAIQIDTTGLLVSPDPNTVALTFAPDGVYDSLDGGFVAQEGRAEVHGTVASIESLKFTNAAVPAYQVYCNNEGELFPIEPPPVGWSIAATDSTDTFIGSGGGTGAWVELTGFTPALIVPQDVDPADVLAVSTRIYLVNSAGNQNGLVDVGFGIDGAAPTDIGVTLTVGNGFEGYIPASWTRAGLTLTSGQALTVWARTRNGSGGPYSVTAEGATAPHSVTIADTNEGGAATTAVFKTQHTWALSGPYAPGDAVAEFRLELQGGQSAALTRVSTWNGTGSGQVTVQRDGAPLGAYSSLSVGTSWTDTTGNVPCATDDRFNFVIDSSTGGELLSVTLSFTHTVTLT